MVLIICILAIGCHDNEPATPIYEVNEAKHTEVEKEVLNGLNDYRITRRYKQ